MLHALLGPCCRVPLQLGGQRALVQQQARPRQQAQPQRQHVLAQRLQDGGPGLQLQAHTSRSKGGQLGSRGGGASERVPRFKAVKHAEEACQGLRSAQPCGRQHHCIPCQARVATPPPPPTKTHCVLPRPAAQTNTHCVLPRPAAQTNTHCVLPHPAAQTNTHCVLPRAPALYAPQRRAPRGAPLETPPAPAPAPAPAAAAGPAPAPAPPALAAAGPGRWAAAGQVRGSRQAGAEGQREGVRRWVNAQAGRADPGQGVGRCG